MDVASRRAPAIPVWAILFSIAFVLAAMVAGYRAIGLPPVVIVGGSGAVGLLLWMWSYRKGPMEPDVILPPFLLTVAGLEVHMIEEWWTGFGPAMSRTFDVSWTERGFLLVFAFIGPILYTLTALGLYKRVALAGFIAWFILIGPGLAELTHFVFPLIRPAIEPTNPEVVSTVVSNGRFVAAMPNYFIGTTERYYFPGLYTAILPMIPGIWGITRMIRASRRNS